MEYKVLTHEKSSNFPLQVSIGWSVPLDYSDEQVSSKFGVIRPIIIKYV